MKTSGRKLKIPVAIEPDDHQGHACCPVCQVAEDRLSHQPRGRPGGDDETEQRQVHALLGEVERQDREQRAEPEPHDELGEEQRDDVAPAVEPGPDPRHRRGSERRPGHPWSLAGLGILAGPRAHLPHREQQLCQRMPSRPKAWSRSTSHARARSAPSMASTSRLPRARCSVCSGPTAPARRQPSGSWPRCSSPMPGARPWLASTSSNRRTSSVQVIGLSGQFAAVDENLTGRENLWMFGRLYQLSSMEARRRADELLEQFDLADAGDRVVKTYSGGMRRRLDLGSALIGRPRILFWMSRRPASTAKPARHVGGHSRARA